MLLESILLYGNLDNDTHILVYTSSEFMHKIKQSRLFDESKIKFEINDTYNNVDLACKSRIDVFQFPQIHNYEKILYLDADILIKDDIRRVFDVCKDDVLYAIEEGEIDNNLDYWGNSLFGNEINHYPDKSAFNTGILLFKNCEKMKTLFSNIKKDIVKRPYHFACYDQPYIVYNAFKLNAYDNKLLKPVAINIYNNETQQTLFAEHAENNFVIHHFPGGPGVFETKFQRMSKSLYSLKNLNNMNN
jgi:lipopolysaccharide biosynthesis glycosyltransferase